MLDADGRAGARGVGDRSIRDVAEAMQVEEGTVKTTLHNARTELRRLLSEETTT